jgi:hypothetical protein
VELIGLILALPVALAVSVAYCIGAALVLTKQKALRPVTLFGSSLVLCGILTEALLLANHGAKGVYARFGIGFALLHEVSFWLGPPAFANLALLGCFLRADAGRLTRVAIPSLLCWFACIGALVGNIAVDEAIVGVDAGLPFFLTAPPPMNPVPSISPAP